MRTSIVVLLIAAGTAIGAQRYFLGEKTEQSEPSEAAESPNPALRKSQLLRPANPTSEMKVGVQPTAQAAASPAANISHNSSQPLDAYAQFQMGNYEGAVQQLRSLIKKYPQDQLIRKNLSTSLLALGFFKLQKKAVADAENAFEESAKLGNADARKALATLTLRQGKIELARELLDEISRSDTDPESYKILIDLALSQDEIERADDLLNRLSETLAKLAASTQQPVKSEFIEFIQSRRKKLEQKRKFLKTQDAVNRQGIEVSYSSPDLRSRAEAVARAIDTVQNKLSHILGPLPAHAKLRAWLVPTNDFRALTDAPPWAAAVFDGYIRIPVARTVNGQIVASETLERLAQHETTHAYIYAFCGDILPSWIGEGLAQIFEGRNLSQSETEIAKSGRRAMQIFEPNLEYHSFIQAPSNKVAGLYARSHLLVHAMSREGGGVEQTWQRILSATCEHRRPLPDVLQEQLSASSARELWNKYFASSGN
jgi:Flp pilus assembly protein TadD